MKSSDKELRKITLKLLEAGGATNIRESIQGDGHLRLTFDMPKGEFFVTLPCSGQSHGRAWQNATARIRRTLRDAKAGIRRFGSHAGVLPFVEPVAAR